MTPTLCARHNIGDRRKGLRFAHVSGQLPRWACALFGQPAVRRPVVHHVNMMRAPGQHQAHPAQQQHQQQLGPRAGQVRSAVAVATFMLPYAYICLVWFRVLGWALIDVLLPTPGAAATRAQSRKPCAAGSHGF